MSYLNQTFPYYPYRENLILNEMFKVLDYSLKEVIGDSNSIIPQILQNLGLALLSILLPLAIVILQQVYKNKTEECVENFKELDLHVILDRVFKTKKLVIVTTFIFIPLLLWNLNFHYIKIFQLIISSVAIWLLGKTLIDIYLWIKGNVFDFRFSYLETLDNLDDLPIVWQSVWRSEMQFWQEQRFFEIFSKTIDKLVN